MGAELLTPAGHRDAAVAFWALMRPRSPRPPLISRPIPASRDTGEAMTSSLLEPPLLASGVHISRKKAGRSSRAQSHSRRVMVREMVKNWGMPTPMSRKSSSRVPHTGAFPLR
jgi:hypothetical protein